MLLGDTVLAAGRGVSGLEPALAEAWAVEGDGSCAGFALLLAVTCSKADVDAVHEFAMTCLRRGLVWLSTVGDGCELAHDLFDDAEVMLTIDEPTWTPEMTVLTTCHTDERPSEVLDFVLDEGQPEDVANGGRACRLLVIADDRSTRALKSHLIEREVTFREI